jgi:hypothetical protein
MKKRALELRANPRLLPQSSLGKALKYFLDEYTAVVGYLRDGQLCIDNNLVENDVRPSVVGRKRWLFIGHPDAGWRSAVIYTIGIFGEGDPDRNPGVLKRLAEATGGEAFSPDRVSEVVAICERIARDIRHQYTIGYVPINPARDGAYHAIRVTAQSKGHGRLSVRTRSGYIAGGEPRLDGKAK